ncbi:MAG: baseplate J/gp47 family protein [Pseudomonadota bacterium]
MSLFTSIDLSELPPPNLVEELDYEAILAATKNELQHIAPDINVDTLLTSDPITKLLEVIAYREMHMRARINEAARGVMLATATGANLDNLAALVNIQRSVIKAADAGSDAVYEDDTRLRARTQLAFEGYSTAGPVGAYIFHALSASAEVKDVAVYSDKPGIVDVRILSNKDNGAASSDLVKKVNQVLTADDIRPLTDYVRVHSADIVPYHISATLTIFAGVGGQQVVEAARQAAEDYIQQHHQLGIDITRASLFAVLHQPGVQNVALHQPAADLMIDRSSAPFGQVSHIGFVEHPIAAPIHLAGGILYKPGDNPQTGQVSGTLSLSAAIEEEAISHYAIYWGANNAQKLPLGVKVYAFNKNQFTLDHGGIRNLEVTSLDGNIIYLMDQDYTVDGITVTALNATLSNAPVRVSYELPPITRLAAGSELRFQFEKETPIPKDATHFIAFSQNEFGEMLQGISTAITPANNQSKGEEA